MHLVITQLEAAASNNRKSNISINIRPIGWTVVGYLPNGQHMFKVNNQNAKFKCKLGKSFFFHIEIEFGGGVSLSLSLSWFISFHFISFHWFIHSFNHFVQVNCAATPKPFAKSTLGPTLSLFLSFPIFVSICWWL